MIGSIRRSGNRSPSDGRRSRAVKAAFAVLALISSLPIVPVASGDERAKAEPTKKLDVLLRDLKSPVPSARVRAATAIGKLGDGATEATGPLCAALVDRHHTVRQAASESLEKVNPEFRIVVFPIAADGDVTKRGASLAKLREMGRDARAALPVILYRYRAAIEQSRRLNNAGPEASACFQTMFLIARDDKTVAELVVALATKSEFADLHKQALEYLPEVDIGDPKRIIGILTDLVRTDADSNKAIAINQLAEFGRKAKSALGVLRVAKGSPSAEVREAATKAVAAIEQDANAQKSSSAP